MTGALGTGAGAGTTMGREIGVTMGDATGAIVATGRAIGATMGDERGAIVDGAMVGALLGRGANMPVIRFKKKRIQSSNDILPFNLSQESSRIGVYYQ